MLNYDEAQKNVQIKAANQIFIPTCGKFGVYIKNWSATTSTGSTMQFVCGAHIYLSTFRIAAHDIQKTTEPRDSQFDSCRAFPHAVQALSRALASTSNSITRLPRKLQLPASMHFFFVLMPPSPSTLQHLLFQILFNFSRHPFSFELTKKPLLSLDLVPMPMVAILKDCVTSVAMLCAVEMHNAIQGNDLK